MAPLVDTRGRERAAADSRPRGVNAAGKPIRASVNTPYLSSEIHSPTVERGPRAAYDAARSAV